METGIATLVCYANVFKDVLGVEDMGTRLGVAGQDKYYSALNELQRQGKILIMEGFAALPGFEDSIRTKASKIEEAGRLIESRRDKLRQLCQNPFIKFVGISGSLAAQNPTRDRNKLVDLDIFLITRKHCMWLYLIPKLIGNVFPHKLVEPHLCVNLIMDGSYLQIANRNFYTATEIRNLIPISGSDTYQRFLQINNWVDYYYPGFSMTSESISETSPAKLINRSLYALYGILRSIKRLSIRPLQEISFSQDILKGISFNRLSHDHGGYQAMITEKFTRLASKWFPEVINSALIEKLFPDDISLNIRKKNIDVFKINAGRAESLDFNKYD